ncbi:hypothetical protein SAMN02745177_02695, partial [Desulforamulus hydrothermalis Lam5 = DSM 18033]
NLAVNYEGDIFAKGGSFSFRRTWVNYIPAVTKAYLVILNIYMGIDALYSE